MDQCSKTARSLCKEPTFNCYPSFMNVQLAYIDVPTCEKHIVLKLKMQWNTNHVGTTLIQIIKMDYVSY